MTFSMLAKSISDMYVKIHSLSIFVYRVQPVKEVRRLHEKLFSKKQALFPVTKSICKNIQSL